jgi:hypothetical protein
MMEMRFREVRTGFLGVVLTWQCQARQDELLAAGQRRPGAGYPGRGGRIELMALSRPDRERLSHNSVCDSLQRYGGRRIAHGNIWSKDPSLKKLKVGSFVMLNGAGGGRKVTHRELPPKAPNMGFSCFSRKFPL